MVLKDNENIRQLGINILTRFMKTDTDNNNKYSGLNLVRSFIKIDQQSVENFNSLILECLKDSDKTIQKMALNIVYEIVNRSNYNGIVKELLNLLLVEESQEQQEELA